MDSMTKLDKKKLKETFKNLGRKYPSIQLAYLHGSYVQGRPTSFSDVDIALVLDDSALKKGCWDLEMDIEYFLEETFKGFDFDVRAMNKAPLDFQGKVITEGERLYVARDLFRADYEEKMRKLYFDFKPFVDAYCNERWRTIKEQGLMHG